MTIASLKLLRARQQGQPLKARKIGSLLATPATGARRELTDPLGVLAFTEKTLWTKKGVRAIQQRLVINLRLQGLVSTFRRLPWQVVKRKPQRRTGSPQLGN